MNQGGQINDIPLDIVGGTVSNFEMGKNNPMLVTHDSDVSGQSFKSVFNNHQSRVTSKSGWAGPGHTQGTMP